MSFVLWHYSYLSLLAQDLQKFSTFKAFAFCMPKSDGEVYICMARWIGQQEKMAL